MRVEAIRREEGLFIPFVDSMEGLKGDRILLDIEMAPGPVADDYADLDKIIGMCSTGRKEDSEKHDKSIYRKENNR